MSSCLQGIQIEYQQHDDPDLSAQGQEGWCAKPNRDTGEVQLGHFRGSAMPLFNQAQEALQNGRFKEAETLFRTIISNDARNFDALHMLGIACSENGRLSEAEQFFLAALSIDSHFPPLFHNYGLFLVKQKRYQESIDQFDKALTLFKNYGPVYCDRGISLMQLGRLEESLASHDTAVALGPNIPIAFYNRANTLFMQKRFDSALRDYDKAIALHPNYAGAYCGRGNVFIELARHDDALAAYDKALALEPDLENAWLGRGNVFLELGRHDDALAAYDKALVLEPDLENAWLGRANVFGHLKRYGDALAAYDKALALDPDLEHAWLGRGNVFLELKRYDDALAAYDKALVLEPGLENAWLGRGNLFGELKRYDDAFAAYDKALALEPKLEAAWFGRGTLFVELGRYDDALAAYDQALALKPDLMSAEGARLRAKMHLCDWSNFKTECEHLTSSVLAKKTNTDPFTFLAISSSPGDQLRCANSWVAGKFAPSREPVWLGERYTHERIRVAYLSADFHQHATSCLMAGMFESHDKSRFDITAISVGPDDDSEMRRRLTRCFEHFVDARALSDEEIVSRIRGLEIDVLIDLKGFTQDARTAVFARRPAPIQVNYIGYPGTMGASYIDYIIADRTVIPDECRKFYSEKVVVLPDTYQVNDSRRIISETAVDPAGLGLPSRGFVFCCFNNNYKITPDVFDCWMRILTRVEDSVLWLLRDNATAAENLKKEASRRGVDGERLVFSGRIPLSEHLARHKLADLCLDTAPCNAHTTASDALWAGVPVLTCAGETFAGRVAASLLRAVGLPELVTTTLDAYQQMAVELATSHERLRIIKSELAKNRLTAPLFDTALYTKHIEAAYRAMYGRYQAGLPPDHIVVPT
jgi:predicted O-linked N-acetylglucosamine transferase (SPINDLY family)